MSWQSNSFHAHKLNPLGDSMTQTDPTSPDRFRVVTFDVNETEHVYCAFIDILGFGKVLDDWSQAVRWYSDVLGMIYPILASQIYRMDDLVESVDSRLRFSAFSDSMVVTSTNVIVLARFCAEILAISLLKGYPLRGCISSGNHIEHVQGDFHFVVSTALRDAYHGESRLATFPRIIIDPRNLDEFKQDLTPIWGQLRNCLVQSDDDYWQVRPMLEQYGSIRPLATWIGECLQRFSSDTRVFVKYAWLADFVNAAVPVDYEVPELYQSVSIRQALALSLTTHPNWEERVIPIWRYAGDIKEARFYFPQRAGFTPLMNPHELDSTFDVNWARFLGKSSYL